MRVEGTELSRCPLCHSSVHRELHDLRYDFGDVVVAVLGVPVTVCEGCSEALVSGPLAVHLDRVVRELAESARLAAREQGENIPALIETEWRLPRLTPELASA